MYLLTTATAVLAGSSLVAGTPIKARSSYAVKETHFVPRGWSNIGRPDPNHVVDLKIGFKNKNFAELERHLMEVSNPAHHRYGQHFSKAEVDALVAPDASAQGLVDEWLEDAGLQSWQRKVSHSKDWISIAIPVAAVEDLLNTKYSTFQHEDGSTLVRTTEWSLPQHLHEHIATIQPTTVFLRPKPEIMSVLLSEGADEHTEDFPPSNSELAGTCNFEGMTPKCLQLLYGTQGYVPQSSDSHVAFTNYLGEIPNRNDTALFLRNFQPTALSSAQTYEQISIDAGPIDNGTGQAGYEGNLDIQTIAGLVYPINITSYSTGGSPPFNPDTNTPTNTNEPYLIWLDSITAQSTLPQTISTSYGDDEQTVPQSYAQAVCEGFAALGLRGSTLLFSSGDNGVGANGTCISNDGKNTTAFLPAFPASCPYITAVGGTRGYPEIVAYDDRNGYNSGSGFSNYFAQPAYQKDSGVVDSYISTIDPSLKDLYNASGRAYPDLAAQSYRFITFYNGSVVTLDGTSAASPAVAGIIALVNDALLAAGKKPLGFLNPWLYSGAGAQAFTDIVNGTSFGCDTAGFAAGKGWDVASGWGTPQFPTILEILGVGNGTANGTASR